MPARRRPDGQAMSRTTRATDRNVDATLMTGNHVRLTIPVKGPPMPTMQTPPGPHTVIDGRRYLYFAGTGYLGLQGHPQVIGAACEAAEQYGMGSATSRTRTGFGDTPPALLTESRAAEFFGTEAALYLPSGYLAPQVLFRALGDHCDVVFLDEHCHDALSDASRILAKPVVRFRHRAPADLLEKLYLHAAGGRRPLVATDGVFPATGTAAPLADYHSILTAFSGAALVVDDAHGVGVLGEHGRGVLEHAGLFDEWANAYEDEPSFGPHPTGPRVYWCASLGKAFGGYGGIIPGTHRFIEHVKIQSPVYSGAAPPPAPLAAATAEGLRIALSEPKLRERLHANTRTLKSGLRDIGFNVENETTPIACLHLDSAELLQRFQQNLSHCGILVAYLSHYPGLPPQGAIRIAVFATHTEAMIVRLLEELCLRRPVAALEVSRPSSEVG